MFPPCLRLPCPSEPERIMAAEGLIILAGDGADVMAESVKSAYRASVEVVPWHRIHTGESTGEYWHVIEH